MIVTSLMFGQDTSAFTQLNIYNAVYEIHIHFCLGIE